MPELKSPVVRASDRLPRLKSWLDFQHQLCKTYCNLYIHPDIMQHESLHGFFLLLFASEEETRLMVKFTCLEVVT